MVFLLDRLASASSSSPPWPSASCQASPSGAACGWCSLLSSWPWPASCLSPASSWASSCPRSANSTDSKYSTLLQWISGGRMNGHPLTISFHSFDRYIYRSTRSTGIFIVPYLTGIFIVPYLTGISIVPLLTGIFDLCDVASIETWNWEVHLLD